MDSRLSYISPGRRPSAMSLSSLFSGRLPPVLARLAYAFLLFVSIHPAHRSRPSK